jgi:hypothetical protein
LQVVDDMKVRFREADSRGLKFLVLHCLSILAGARLACRCLSAFPSPVRQQNGSKQIPHVEEFHDACYENEEGHVQQLDLVRERVSLQCEGGGGRDLSLPPLLSAV